MFLDRLGIAPGERVLELGPRPGLLSAAMHIDCSLSGQDLVIDHFCPAMPPQPVPFEVVTTPRIGVGYAAEWARAPLRSYMVGSPFVSRR